jgi:CreA protein
VRVAALRRLPFAPCRAYLLAAINREVEMRIVQGAGLAGTLVLAAAAMPAMAQSPDLIFKKSTVFRFLTPDDKLATYAIDDPDIEGVACHYTVPEKGGVAGGLGLAEEVSDISLACRQVGPVKFRTKVEQGEVMFRQSRSLLFKRMQIVRGCDVKRNVLVYLVYSDKLIEGSPKNSTSTVPIMPWGGQEPVQCRDWLK